MDLAKPGLIKQHCLPNAMCTFSEYLVDFADDALRKTGSQLIDRMLAADIQNTMLRTKVRENLQKIQAGQRDLYF